MPRSFAPEMEILKIGAIKERAAEGRTGEKKRGERLEGSSYLWAPHLPLKLLRVDAGQYLIIQ